MEAAVKKHGKVDPPSHHIEDFYTRISDERNRIIAQS